MATRQIWTPEELGTITRAVRKQHGIRQDDLAAMINASHVLVGDIEQGKPTVNIGKVLQLLDELGIRVYLETPDE